MSSETKSANSMAQSMDAKKEVISGATSSAPKKTVTSCNSAKASPSSRTPTSSVTQSSAATGRKFGEDTIRDLKKNITFLNDENLVLKTKLRRSEDDNARKEKYILQLREATKNGSDKSATNSAMTQLKRRIQNLEHTLREKETVIRQLQNDARIAAQSASWSNIRKETTPKSHSNPPRSFASNSPPNRVSQSGLQAENEKLKRQLRRALAVEESDIMQYSDLGTDELIAFIVRLNQDIENLKKNRKNSEPVDESTVFQLQAEVEKLSQELRRLKVDRQDYFEDCESKSGEIKALRQEIDKLHKELSNARETVKKTPSPNLKRASGLVTSPTVSHTQTLPRIRTTKVERSQEVKSSTTGTNTSTRVKLTSPSQTTKKSETRRTVTTVTKVTTASPVKIKATKVTVDEKKPTVESTNVEISSVDIEKKLLEQIKLQEPCVEKETQEPCVEKETQEPASMQEPEKSEQGKADTDEKLSEGAKIEINIENQVPEKHEEFRQNIAAKKIQRQWRKHNTEKQQVHFSSQDDDDDLAPVTDKEADIERFKQNRAAKTIQKQWRAHQEKGVKVDGEETILTTTTMEGEENHVTSGDDESETCLSPDGNDKQQLDDDDDEMPSIIPEVTNEQVLEEKINGEQEHD